MSPETRTALVAALSDENGLAPTDTALKVIVAVIDATGKTDEDHCNLPGIPSLDLYAADAVCALNVVRRTR